MACQRVKTLADTISSLSMGICLAFTPLNVGSVRIKQFGFVVIY